MKKGFSIMEMMIVVAVIGLLSSIAHTWYAASQNRARRVESVVTLEGLQVSQFTYLAAYDEFAETFDGMDFRVNGEPLTGAVYQGRRYTYTLSRPWGTRSWFCTSSAELDGDAWPDLLMAYERL